MKKSKALRTIAVVLIGLVLILAGSIFSLFYGAKDISFRDALSYLFYNDGTMEAQIIRDLRLPRTICAILTGCFLAASGSVMQGVTRNPIASPSVMGITQGAALAVSLNMIFQPFSGPMGRVICALIGALISALLVFFMSLKKSGVQMVRMILAGTAMGSLFLSLASMIALLTNNTKNLGFWIAGGLSGSSWSDVRILVPVALVSIVYTMIISPKITALSLGDEVAIGLGEKPNQIRILSLAAVVVLNGTAAAVGGNIGYVCLIVPQIARLLAGSDYRFNIPVSMVFGGVLLIYGDILARMLANPFETPLGAITSVLGVPVLIYLIRRSS